MATGGGSSPGVTRRPPAQGERAPRVTALAAAVTVLSQGQQESNLQKRNL